jgi:hypothetical protein
LLQLLLGQKPGLGRIPRGQMLAMAAVAILRRLAGKPFKARGAAVGELDARAGDFSHSPVRNPALNFEAELHATSSHSQPWSRLNRIQPLQAKE